MNNEIQKQFTKLALAPALLLYRGSLKSAAQSGVILFYHGLGASKETGIKELTSLAQAGYLAVAIDNIGHGERRFQDFEIRFSTKNPDLDNTFINAVKDTAHEVPAIIGELIRHPDIQAKKIGIAGISMGGYITYAAMLNDKRIEVAAPILGSPIWGEEYPYSPHHHLDGFFPRAILSQNAGKDLSVPPDRAREFHRRLAPYYASMPDRLRYVEFPDAGHFMPESDWNKLWNNVLDWFHRFLRP